MSVVCAKPEKAPPMISASRKRVDFIAGKYMLIPETELRGKGLMGR